VYGLPLFELHTFSPRDIIFLSLVRHEVLTAVTEDSGTGEGFLRLLWFPLTIIIPPTTPHSSSIIRGWYNRPNSGRRTKWTQSYPTPTN
jgi:hypothetical protein